jgi:hypothetical protein
MPLRDHFHPPLSNRRSWDWLHGGWPMTIASDLNRQLPERYVAGPQVHLAAIEIDVAAFDQAPESGLEFAGGPVTAVWAPPRPTLAVVTEPDADAYEVCIYENSVNQRLVAAIELVSPSNKDRAEHRGDFLAKCVSMLRSSVCVSIVDVVTNRTANLYGELMAMLGQTDPFVADGPIYAATCRWSKSNDHRLLESWAHRLAIGQALPTLPVWLDDGLAVPLELEASYEETCRSLRMV